MQKSFKDELEFFCLDPDQDETYIASGKLWCEAKATTVQGALIHCVSFMKDKLLIRKGCKAALDEVKKWSLPLPKALKDRADRGVWMEL